jgi:hypothetical protein
MAKMWDPENSISSASVFSGSGKGPYKWICVAGHKFEDTAHHVRLGRECNGMCPRKVPSEYHGYEGLPWPIILERCRKAWGYLYDYIESSYTMATAKFDIICHKPGHGVFKKYVYNHLRGEGCKNCSTEQTNSLSLRLVLRYFTLTSIRIETEYSFDDLRGKTNRPYRYDILAALYRLLVESDGQQHFKSVKSWGGEKNLLDNKARDIAKDIYATSNKFNFVRIPYWATSLEVVKILIWATNMIISVIHNIHNTLIMKVIITTIGRSQ